jgi:hypothetical protein
VEIKDFDEWYATMQQQEVQFQAVYDNATGQVTSVGPSHAFVGETNKIDIDAETAELIIEGKIKLTSCFVDMQNNTLEIAEIKTMFKIDDVLHRVISVEYTDVIPDVFLSYDSQIDSLTVTLSTEYNGKRKVLWAGETVINLLITDYNDPNILYNMLSLTVSDLVGKSVTFDNINAPPKFSVYTRRLFKNYVIEYK